MLLRSGQTQSCPALWTAGWERVWCGRVHPVLLSSPWGDRGLCSAGWVLLVWDGRSQLSVVQEGAGSKGVERLVFVPRRLKMGMMERCG